MADLARRTLVGSCALVLLFAASPLHAAERVTVASLVPAATDLILGIGARDHLVAVSNWDADRPEISGLPRVGDYRTVDWEAMIELRPSKMIVQYSEDKMPPGLRERAKQLNIEIINVKFQRLEDVLSTLTMLGDALGKPELADRAKRAFVSELDEVAKAVEGREPVTVLIGRASSSLETVGGNTFLDDVLKIARGSNVTPGTPDNNNYPSIDREMLLSYNPQVVINLLPGASEQVIEQARQYWQDVPQVQAVKDGRVYYLTEPYLLLPGISLAKVARQFAKALHPDIDLPDEPTSIPAELKEAAP